jgi:hypothetical protein
VIGVPVALLAVAVAATPMSALDKCRALDKEFDTKNMPKPCQAAADDPSLTIPERVEALRRLALAHILNGDESLAEPDFLKMLVFAPTTDLPADAGPRVREIFVAVKKRFDAEGKLAVSFTPPPAPHGNEPVALQIDVVDRLGRVVSARIRATTQGAVPLEEKLVRNELGPGQVRFSGNVPEAPAPAGAAAPPEPTTVDYDVIFDGWDGNPVAAPAPVHGTFTRGAPAVASDDAFPWLWVGVGGVGVLAVAGAVTSGVVYCYSAGSCRTQDAWVRVQIHQGAP